MKAIEKLLVGSAVSSFILLLIGATLPPSNPVIVVGGTSGDSATLTNNNTFIGTNTFTAPVTFSGGALFGGSSGASEFYALYITNGIDTENITLRNVDAGQILMTDTGGLVYSITNLSGLTLIDRTLSVIGIGDYNSPTNNDVNSWTMAGDWTFTGNITFSGSGSSLISSNYTSNGDETPAFTNTVPTYSTLYIGPVSVIGRGTLNSYGATVFATFRRDAGNVYFIGSNVLASGTTFVAKFITNGTSDQVVLAEIGSSTEEVFWESYGSYSIKTNPFLASIEISDIYASPATTNATITWNTSIAANSTVEYGTEEALGSEEKDSSSVTEHSIILTNLVADTLYYYRISGTNGLSSSVSDIQTFTTSSENSITNDIYAYYKLSSTADSSGNGYTLTSVGSPTNAVGIVSNCYGFPASSSVYLRGSDNDLLSPGPHSLTVCSWFKLVSTNDSVPCLFGHDNASDGSLGWTFAYSKTYNALRFYYSTNAASTGRMYVYCNTNNINLDGWYWICASINATNGMIGTCLGDSAGNLSEWREIGPYGIANTNITSYLYIGRSGGGNAWNGYVDETLIWTRTLSANERTNIYQKGLNGQTVF